MFRAYGTLLFGFRITHGLKSVSKKCVEPTALRSRKLVCNVLEINVLNFGFSGVTVRNGGIASFYIFYKGFLSNVINS